MILAESLPLRPRTQRSIARRRAALRHDIEVAGTSRAKPPRDYSWRQAVILLLLNIILIALAMRWDGYFDWW
ncbi:MAG: hypothetical protein JNL82_14555 [Myxococcales bacterium]|nr:hypothetical protein [Myxococcales bacterium]